MSATYQCTDPDSLSAAVDHAARVMADGECIVMPTDTVYGIGCDAFSPMGVQTLLGAKGRTRQMPPPVLIADPGVMAGLADQVSDEARMLAEAFWPGALTLVCWAQPTLGWDLGETHGTVALRVPDDDVARSVLERVGPMAVSSANLTGMSAATTADEAKEMLQDRVALYLDDGVRPARASTSGQQVDAGVPSTIVDCTGEVPVVLRLGAIGLEQLRTVVASVDGGEYESEESDRNRDESEHTDLTDQPIEGDATAHEPGPAASAPVPDSETAIDRWKSSPDMTGRAPRSSAGQPLVEPGAPEADVARALVQNASATPRARVDQNRNRNDASQPRWGGTPALSVDEANQLVNGD